MASAPSLFFAPSSRRERAVRHPPSTVEENLGRMTLGGSGLMVKALGQMEKNAIGGAAARRGDTRNPPKEGGFPVERARTQFDEPWIGNLKAAEQTTVRA
jgi:hypothetical protein